MDLIPGIGEAVFIWEPLLKKGMTGKSMAVSLKPKAGGSYQALLTIQECSDR